ncbi:MAG: alanine racemase [Nitrospinae bacterium]|nr:alanine racemase [Nitrospinota bacterium]
MKTFHPMSAKVDMDRLHANVDIIAKTAGVPLLPVVKANAYGHGAVTIGLALSQRRDVAGLCVGTIAEAVELRLAGYKGRLIVLDGIFAEQSKVVADMELEVVISSLQAARALARHAGKRPVPIHFKINTGMTRLGAHTDEAIQIYEKVASLKGVEIVALMTHLADSGMRGGFTDRQVGVFDDIVSALRSRGFRIPPRHAANTGGIFLHPGSRYDLARPGIGVYGVQEFEGKNVALSPVLSLTARISHIQHVKRGMTVSYSMKWTSPGERDIAVVQAGYADGYSRSLSGNTRAIVKGRAARQVGVICMDNAMFDVTGLGAKVGDEAVLIGEDGAKKITVHDLAVKAGTISYEILCGIGRRAPRLYVKGGRVVKTVSSF